MKEAEEDEEEEEFERYLLGIKWSHGWIEALKAVESENEELGDDVDEQVDVRLKLFDRFLLCDVRYTVAIGFPWFTHWAWLVSVEW